MQIINKPAEALMNLANTVSYRNFVRKFANKTSSQEVALILKQEAIDLEQKFSGKSFAPTHELDQIMIASLILKAYNCMMLGYPVRNAAFYSTQLTSSNKQAIKRIGYMYLANCDLSVDNDAIQISTNSVLHDLDSCNSAVIESALEFITKRCDYGAISAIASKIQPLLTNSISTVSNLAVMALLALHERDPDMVPLNIATLAMTLKKSALTTKIALAALFLKLSQDSKNSKLSENRSESTELFDSLFSELNTLRSKRSNINKQDVPNYTLYSYYLLTTLSNLANALEYKQDEFLKFALEWLNQNKPVSEYDMAFMQTLIHILSKFELTAELLSVIESKIGFFLEHENKNLNYVGLNYLPMFVKINPKILSTFKNPLLQCLRCNDLTIQSSVLNAFASAANSENYRTILKYLYPLTGHAEVLQHYIKLLTTFGESQEEFVEMLSELVSATAVSFNYKIIRMCINWISENIIAPRTEDESKRIMHRLFEAAGKRFTFFHLPHPVYLKMNHMNQSGAAVYAFLLWIRYRFFSFKDTVNTQKLSTLLGDTLSVIDCFSSSKANDDKDSLFFVSKTCMQFLQKSLDRIDAKIATKFAHLLTTKNDITLKLIGFALLKQIRHLHSANLKVSVTEERDPDSKDTHLASGIIEKIRSQEHEDVDERWTPATERHLFLQMGSTSYERVSSTDTIGNEQLNEQGSNSLELPSTENAQEHFDFESVVQPAWLKRSDSTSASMELKYVTGVSDESVASTNKTTKPGTSIDKAETVISPEMHDADSLFAGII